MSAPEAPAANPRRERILDAIEAHWREHGYAPSVRDVAAVEGCAFSTAIHHIRELERAGRVVRAPGVARSLRVMQR